MTLAGDSAKSVSDDSQSTDDGTQSFDGGSHSVNEGSQGVSDGTQSVKPDYLTISVKKGRFTGEKYFTIGVKVTTRFDGNNKVDLRVEMVYGPPGQPDSDVFAREADSMRLETLRSLLDVRARIPFPPPPEGKGRLEAYQALWQKICEKRLPSGSSVDSPVEDSQLRDFALEAFQLGWTKLDLATQETLLHKRLTGTIDTSPLDKLSRQVESALNERIRSEIVQSLEWSCFVPHSKMNEELHFFQYTSGTELIEPITLAYPYKAGGACISHQGINETLPYNEDLCGFYYDYVMLS